MCFSAEASFIAAGVTAIAGGVAVLRSPSANLIPLAAVPLVFALQQSIEGLIWIGLSDGAPDGALNQLSRVFLIVGEALWPFLIPIAVLAAEPKPERRRALLGAVLLGAVLFTAFTFLILAADYSPEVRNNCICYPGEVGWTQADAIYPFARTDAWRLSGLDWTVVPYALVTIGSLLISSHNSVRLFGIVTGIGLIVSLILYRETLVSVWCFFAALASCLVVKTIEDVRRERKPTPPLIHYLEKGFDRDA